MLKSKVPNSVLDEALEAARRAAAVDTNAIEGVFATDRGFTRTVAAKAEAWEQAMEMKGKHVRPAFEDTLAGFEMVLDLMTGFRPITQSFIRELHATMMRSQETYMVYASVESTEPEMTRLIDELNSEEFQAASSVVQAAYAHYAFVCIHPFSDGNGRVARALASVFLYRSPGVPLVVYQDQRAQYIGALEAELSAISETSNAAELAGLLANSRFSPKIEDAAARFQGMLHSELEQRAQTRSKECQLKFEVSLTATSGVELRVPDQYEQLKMDYGVTLYVHDSIPERLIVTVSVVLGAKSDDDAEFDLLAQDRNGRQLGFYLREIDPAISESLRQRVQFYADAVMNDFLGQVVKEVRQIRPQQS